MKYDTNPTTSIELTVRDYECDLWQGVGHSEFLKYFQIARSEHVKKLFDLNIHKLFNEHNNGFVVSDLHIKYKKSLFPEQSFSVETKMERRDNFRFIFFQDIYTQKTNSNPNGAQKKPIATAVITITSVNGTTGRPEASEELNRLMKTVQIIEENS